MTTKMPKHPLWFLGVPSRPSYRGATHDVVYRGDDDEIRKQLTDELEIANLPMYTAYNENINNGDPPDVTLALMEAYLGTVQYNQLTEVDTDSVYVNSFQLLWEKDHGKRIRFVQRYTNGTEMPVHIDAFKDVVRFRPDELEVKEQLWTKQGAFFGDYTEQKARVCISCFDLYPSGYGSDLFSTDLNPERVNEVRLKIRHFLKKKLSTSKNVFGDRKTTDLMGKWTSYRTLEISERGNGANKCTIEVTASTNDYYVNINATRKIMGGVMISGTNAFFNERVMGLFDTVCERFEGEYSCEQHTRCTTYPKDQRLSAWKTIYDFSRELRVIPDVLDLQNLLDSEGEASVYNGTGTEDALYSRFDDMKTTPTDGLFLKFDDTTQHHSSLTYSTPMTYNGGIGPLGNVLAQM